MEILQLMGENWEKEVERMNRKGPKARIIRRFGEAFAHSPKYARILEKRKQPPGQHGLTKGRQRMGEYGKRLFEKQKLKAIYNISEAQMLRYMKEATRRSGPSGGNLLLLLERRLDNIVFRFGLSTTIWGARQLVNHGHVKVNNRRVNIPSFLVKPADVISVSEKVKNNPHIISSLDLQAGIATPPYLSFDREKMLGTLERLPARNEIPVNIQESLIVEFYAR
jgi:small subunit ribosomal protein S4